MGTRSADGPVLVAVGNPEHVEQLVRTAGDLARGRSGTVRVVTVVAKPRDSPFGVFADETIRREFAGESHELVERAVAPPDVVVEREVVVARSIAGGILGTVRETDPAALVVGWQGPSRRTDALLGTTVDRLVERAPCDLYVERVGREADGVGSVLLPVAGGPHVRAAATAARAIAERNDARVHVLSVVTDRSAPGTGSPVAAGHVAEARGLLGADGERGASDAGTVESRVPVVAETVDAGDVTDALVEAAADHDVVVMGATRQGPLRGRLVGSVPRRVVDRTDATVILARDAGVVGGLLGRLGGLLRR
jgi:nucleotide-binding universal stress UspA family protein